MKKRLLAKKILAAVALGSMLYAPTALAETYQGVVSGGKQDTSHDSVYYIGTTDGTETGEYATQGAEVMVAGGTGTETHTYDLIFGGYNDSDLTVTLNEVTISGGTAYYIYGGSSSSGVASENTITMSGGSVSRIYGGKSGVNGTVSKNTVTISGGSVGDIVYGGDNGATIKENAVTISGGTVNSVYGGNSSASGIVTENTVTISNGSVTGSVYGGRSSSGTASKNTVIMSGGTVNGFVAGGETWRGVASENTVTISDGSVGNNVYGGYSTDSGTITGNAVMISGGSIGGSVYGGFSESGEVKNNKVTVKDVVIKGDIYGGYSSSGEVSNNAVSLDGVILQGTHSVAGGVTSGAISGNSLEIKGITVDTGANITIQKFDNITSSSGATITNNGELTFTNLGNDITLGSKITGDGTTTFASNMRVDALVDTATINVNTGATIKISADNVGQDITNAGTVELDGGTLTNDINGNVTLIDDLTIGKDAHDTDNVIVIGTLTANGKNVDMQDGTCTTLQIAFYHNDNGGIGKLKIDVDLENGKYDSIVNSADDISTTTILSDINILTEKESADAPTAIGSIINMATLKFADDADKLIKFTSDYKYTFTLSDGNKLMYQTSDPITLADYIAGGCEGVDTITNFEVTKDTVTSGTVGAVDTYLMDHGKSGREQVELDLRGYDLSANVTGEKFDGILIATGKKLVVKGQGTGDDISVISNFNKAFDNSGTLDVSYAKFENNNIGIYNNGNLNVSNTKFEKNGYGIYNEASGVVNLDNVEFEGTDPEKANALAFTNFGTVNMKNMVLANIASNGNDSRDGVINVQEGVTFKGIVFGGTERILPVSGGVVNIDSADGLTLKIYENGGTAVTDEYSVGFKLQKGANGDDGILKITNGVYKFNETVDVDGIALTSGTATFNKHSYDDVDGLVLGSNVKTITVDGNSQVILDGHKKSDGGTYQNDTLTADVEGAGTLTIKSDVILQDGKKIGTALDIAKDASLQAKADQLIISDGLSATNGTIKNEGVLTLTGGELKRSVAEGMTDNNVGKVVAAGELTIGENVEVAQTIYGGEDGSGNYVASVTLNDGSEVLQVIGVEGTTGNVSNGTVAISGTGTITGNDRVYAVAGGYSAQGDANNNFVNVSGGTMSIDVRGGYSGDEIGTHSANYNKVEISEGTFGGCVAGGCSGNGNANNNEVTVSGGTFSGYVIGGHSAKGGEASGNIVTINNGEFNGSNICGGLSDSSSVTNNTVNFYGGTFSSTETIYGGYSSGNGNVTNNTVNVGDGSNQITLETDVYGGYSKTGSVSGNTVNVSNAILEANIYGGRVNEDTKDQAYENNINLENVEIGENDIEIYASKNNEEKSGGVVTLTNGFVNNNTGTTTTIGGGTVFIETEITGSGQLILDSVDAQNNSTITQASLTNEGTLTSNLDNLVISGELTNNGTLNVIGGTLREIQGTGGTTVLGVSGEAVYKGKYDNENKLEIENTLVMNGKKIDMQDSSKDDPSNAKYSTLTLGGLAGTGSLALDVDLKENTNDKLSINSAIDGTVITLASLNIVDEDFSEEAPALATDTHDPIEIAALATGAEGKVAVSLGSDVKTIVTDCYKYEFAAEKNNDKWTGKLTYTRTDSTINLTKYIEHEIDEYTFRKNIAVEKDKTLIGILDKKGKRPEVSLDMYGFDLIGYVDGSDKKTNGVQINKDGNLIVNGTHTDDETGNTNNSIIKDFDTAFKNYGTLTLKDVTLSGNNVGVDNGFTIPDTKPVLNIDCTDAAHPMEFTDQNTVKNNENAVVNVLGDLIVNKGSMTGGSVCVSTTETTSSGTKGTLTLKTTEDWNLDFKILQGTSGTNSVVVVDASNTGTVSIGNVEARYNETWFDAKELQVNAATNAVVSTLGENLDKVTIADTKTFKLDNKIGEDSKAAFSVSGGTMVISNTVKDATSKIYWAEDKDADGNFLYTIDSAIKITEKVEKIIGSSEDTIYEYTGIMQANASQLTGTQDIENAGILILMGGTLGRDVVKGQHIVYEYEGSRKYEAGEVKDGFPQTEEVFGKVVVTPEEVTIGDGVNNVEVEETIYGSIDSGTNNVININLNGGTVAQIIGGRGTSEGSVVSDNIITINATDAGGEVTGYEDSSGVSKNAAVYGGIGDSAKNNQVNINGGSYLNERIVGGNGNIEIENNTITITGGTFGDDVDIKAGSGKGIVKENIVTISGGTFASDQILGAEVSSATAEGNGVSISGGTFSSSSKDITWIAGVEGDVRKDKQSTITKNFVEISDGSFDVSKDTIIAGAMDDPEATMETGFSGNVYDGNSVTISGGTFTVQDAATLSIYGAKSVKGNVNNSVVEISDVEIQANIYGGETSDGGVSGGTINISNAKVTGDIVGGLITGTTGTVKNNVLTITDSEVTGNIYGGKAENTDYTGTVSGNTVNLDGSTIKGVTDGTRYIYGGYSGATSEIGHDNIVNLDDVTFEAGNTYEVWSSKNDSGVSNGTINVGSITNNGTLTLKAESLNIDGDIIATVAEKGDLTIDAVAENNAKITQNSLTNKGTLTTNLDDIDVKTLTNSGNNAEENNAVLKVSGGALRDIAGAGTIILQNTVTVKDDDDHTATISSGTLNLNGQEINMQDGAFETISVNKLTGTGGSIRMDVGLATTGGEHDTFLVTENSDAILSLHALNLVNEGDAVSGTLENVFSGVSSVSFVDGGSIKYTTGRKYTFAVSENKNITYFWVTSEVGLKEYIDGTISDFSVTADTQLANCIVDKMVGEPGAEVTNPRENVQVFLNGYTLTKLSTSEAKKQDGIKINENGSLTVDGVGSGSADGISDVKDFKTAFDNEGTLTLTNLQIYGNKIGVNNATSGTLNMEKVDLTGDVGGVLTGNTVGVQNTGVVNMKDMNLKVTEDNKVVIANEGGTININGDVKATSKITGTTVTNAISRGTVNIADATLTLDGGGTGYLADLTTAPSNIIDFVVGQVDGAGESTLVLENGYFDFVKKNLDVNVANLDIKDTAYAELNVEQLGENLDSINIYHDGKVGVKLIGGESVTSSGTLNASIMGNATGKAQVINNIILGEDAEIATELDILSNGTNTDKNKLTHFTANASQLTGEQEIKNDANLILTGGTLTRDVIDGAETGKGQVVVTAGEDGVTINNAEIGQTIFGGTNSANNVLHLTFEGNDNKITKIIGGGMETSASSGTHAVTIEGTGKIASYTDGGIVQIYGGYSTSVARQNTVTVKDITLQNSTEIYGGYYQTSSTGTTSNVTNNTVVLDGVTFEAGENKVIANGSNIAVQNGLTGTVEIGNKGIKNNFTSLLIGNGNGTLNINGDITGTGTGNLTIDSYKAFNNAKISQGNLTNKGEFTTNLDDIDVTNLTNSGNNTDANNAILHVTGGGLRNIEGKGTTKLEGDVTANADATIAGMLDLNGREIDMQNETYTTLSVGTVTGIGNIKMDADLSDATEGGDVNSSYDKINVGKDINSVLTLTGLNLTKEATVTNGTLKDMFKGISKLNMDEEVKEHYTSEGYKYTFTFSNGDLKFEKIKSTKNLSEYIAGTIDEFSVTGDIKVENDQIIGTVDSDRAERRSDVPLYLNGNVLEAHGNQLADGIIVKDGSKLSVDGKDPDGGDNSVIKNFNNAFVNEKGGTLNVSNATFEDNAYAIKNNGNLNVSGTTTFKDSVSGSGKMTVKEAETVVTVDGADVNNTISVGKAGVCDFNDNWDIINSTLPKLEVLNNGKITGDIDNKGYVAVNNGGKVTGTLNNDGIVDINSDFNGTLNNKSSGMVYVNDDAGYLKKNMVNDGVVIADGGTLSSGMTTNGEGELIARSNVTIQEKPVNQDTIAVFGGKTLTVGGTAQGIASANETDNAGIIKVENTGNSTLDKTSRYATGTTTLNGAYVVGANGLLTLGSTDNNDAANFIARTDSKINWGSYVTGGVYITKPISIANGSLCINGSNNGNGTLSLGSKGLMMVAAANMTTSTSPAVRDVTNLSIANDAMIYLRGAKTGQDIYITDRGAGGVDVNNLNLNGLGSNFKATAINDGGQLKIHIDQGSLNVLQETVIPFIGKSVESGTSGELGKFMDNVANYTREADAINAVNAMANIGEVVGVEHNIVSLAHNFETSVFNRLSVTTRRPVERGGFYGGSSKIKLRNVMMDRNDHFDLGGIDSVSRVSTVRRGRVADLMPKRNNIEFSNRHYGEEIEKGIWAGLVKSKEKVEDLQLGQIKSNYDANIKGATVGADLWSSETNVGGVAIIYADGDVTSNNGRVSTRSDVKYYGAGIYDRQDLPGNMALVVEANYVQGKNDIVQNNSNMEIKAKPKSQMANAGVRIEKMFGGERGHFVPYAGVQYSHLENESYKNSLDVKYSSKKMEIVSIPVGFRVGGSNQSESGWKVAPYAELGYIFNTGDIKNRLKVAYEGITDSFGYKVMDKGVFFTTAGFVICRDAYVIQLGYSYRKGKHTHDRKLTADVKFDF